MATSDDRHLTTATPPPGDNGEPPAVTQTAGTAGVDIFITPLEHVVTCRVTNALACDPELFQRDGALVRPMVLRNADPPPAARRLVWQRPAGVALLRQANEAFIRLRITTHCHLTE